MKRLPITLANKVFDTLILLVPVLTYDSEQKFGSEIWGGVLTLKHD